MATRKGSVSETAHWIATFRAQETARPDALFRDPFAASLAGPYLHDAPPGVPSWPLVARTKLIDDLVLRVVSEGIDRVVNLAAGLDTRPYRLELPATLRWIEADLPAMIDFKTEALAKAQPRCSVERHKVDLADERARDAFLDEALQGNALVISEGLLVYLAEPAVRSLANALRARPAAKLWMTDVSSPGILKMMRDATDARLDAPDRMKFAPENGVAYFEGLGFRLRELQSMFKAAARFKRLPLWMRPFALLPDANPRKPGDRPWGAVALFERA